MYALPRYYYSGTTFAVTEPDGVRVIGSDTCDFIQKVPGIWVYSDALAITNCVSSINFVRVPAGVYNPCCYSIRRLGKLQSTLPESGRQRTKYTARPRESRRRLH